MKKYVTYFLLCFCIFSVENTEIEEDFFIDNIMAEAPNLNSESFFSEDIDDNLSISDVAADLLKKSTTFTGDFSFDSKYSNYTNKPANTGDFTSSIESNIYLDVRLNDGMKAFTSVELKKYNVDTTVDFLKLNEMFFDFNLENKVYVRLGKQNLAWGRGYFFNPSDLINIGDKTIDDLTGSRTGNYGIKIHVPQGITKNYYAYIKAEDKENVEDLDLALKYEFLFKKTEYSIGAISLGEDNSVVFSLDFASSLGGAQTFGEVAIQDGEKVEFYQDGINIGLGNKIVLQGSVGYSKTFDKVGKDEENKSIMLIQEFYYNGAGYSKQEKESYLKYNPYTDGKFYLANFLTFNKFINKDTTLGLNLLSGFSDSAHQINGSYSYKLNDDLTFGFDLTSYFGTGSNSYTGDYSLPNFIIGANAKMVF